MVHVVIFRLYSPAEAIALAGEPDLMMKKIRSDRQRSPMAVIEVPTVEEAAEIVATLSRAFGVCVMDINHGCEPLDPSLYLLDQGRALVAEAEQINQSS